MSTNDIPKDIRSAAAVIGSDLRVALFEIDTGAAKLWGSDGVIAAMNDAIALALMVAKEEEREACAAYLVEKAKASPLGHESVQRGSSTFNWLTYCADLIRKRGDAS